MPNTKDYLDLTCDYGDGVIVCINKSIKELSLYDATRGNWTFAKNKVKEIEIILARNREKIVYALIPDKWHSYDQANGKKRWYCDGCEVPPKIWDLYVDKFVSKDFTGHTPFKYFDQIKSIVK